MAVTCVDYKGILKGHSGWVTKISTPSDLECQNISSMIASSSRDGKVIIWRVDPSSSDSNFGKAGDAVHSFTKHNDVVSDVQLSSTGEFLLSASWDKTIRLWDVNSAISFRTFIGHSKEVTAVAMSAGGRQIVSGSRDNTIRLWNTLGEEKYNLEKDKHNGWVSAVKFSPVTERNIVVSAGRDNLAKVWNLENCSLMHNLVGHTGPINDIAVAPDGSLFATASSDGTVKLWDFVDKKHLCHLEANSTVHALCYHPINYWLCAATETSIKIWDLEKQKLLSDIRLVGSENSESKEVELQEFKRSKNRDSNVLASLTQKQKPSKHLPWCTSLTWSPNGLHLYAGSSNGSIYVFGLRHISKL